MPSRIIEIRRKGNTSRLPDEVYDESKQNIGSTFTPSGDVNTGLTREEEKKYMPYILGMSDTDVNFPREVKEYFKSLTINVPKKGVKLEIGLDDNKEPINVLEWIKYKFALANSAVSREEQADGSNVSGRALRFFIYDRTRKLEQEAKQTTSRKSALKEFIQLTADTKRMDMVLRIFGYNPETMDALEKEPLLEKAAMEDPVKFVATVQDKNLEVNAFIKECLSKQILRKEGNTIFNVDDPIGASMEEAVAYLRDAKNSDVVVTLKARLKAIK